MVLTDGPSWSKHLLFFFVARHGNLGEIKPGLFPDFEGTHLALAALQLAAVFARCFRFRAIGFGDLCLNSDKPTRNHLGGRAQNLLWNVAIAAGRGGVQTSEGFR